MLLHSLRTGFCVRKLLALSSSPLYLDLSSSGLIALVQKTHPKRVSVYSINGSPVRQIEQQLPVTSLCFSQSCDLLVLGSDKTVHITPVFGEFPTETFRAKDSETPKLRTWLCTSISGACVVCLLSDSYRARATTTIHVEQLNSESHLTEVANKFGF